MEKKIDLDSCRICLRTAGSKSETFTRHTLKIGRANLTVAEMFNFTTGFAFEAADPPRICYKCRQELVICYQFLQKCRDTEDFLRTEWLDTLKLHVQEHDEAISIEVEEIVDVKPEPVVYLSVAEERPSPSLNIDPKETKNERAIRLLLGPSDVPFPLPIPTVRDALRCYKNELLKRVTEKHALLTTFRKLQEHCKVNLPAVKLISEGNAVKKLKKLADEYKKVAQVIDSVKVRHRLDREAFQRDLDKILRIYSNCDDNPASLLSPWQIECRKRVSTTPHDFRPAPKRTKVGSQDSEEADIESVYRQLDALEDPGKARKRSAYWKANGIIAKIARIDPDEDGDSSDRDYRIHPSYKEAIKALVQ